MPARPPSARTSDTRRKKMYIDMAEEVRKKVKKRTRPRVDRRTEARTNSTTRIATNAAERPATMKLIMMNKEKPLEYIQLVRRVTWGIHAYMKDTTGRKLRSAKIATNVYLGLSDQFKAVEI